MIVIQKGHCYELENFENKDRQGQILQFIEKENRVNSATTGLELVTINDGTTNEEVLKVLIDRLYSLNNTFPCKENRIVIVKLEESLMWLERRTQLRVEQNVEGKAIPHKES